MDINDIRSVMTLLAFVTFCLITVWAYSRGAKKGFDEAQALPFHDDDKKPGRTERGDR
jgi:cytochrome c oxidase cbb3-type subunit 4